MHLEETECHARPLFLRHGTPLSVATFFASAPEPLTKDPTLVVAAFNGIARRILEAKSPERELEPLRAELIILVHVYLGTGIAAPTA